MAPRLLILRQTVALSLLGSEGTRYISSSHRPGGRPEVAPSSLTRAASGATGSDTSRTGPDSAGLDRPGTDSSGTGCRFCGSDMARSGGRALADTAPFCQRGVRQSVVRLPAELRLPALRWQAGQQAGEVRSGAGRAAGADK